MKTLKKLLISVTAAAISTASFCSMLPSHADSEKYIAYSYYFDVPANTYVKGCDAVMSYNPENTTYVRNSTGNLGGTFAVSDVRTSNTSRKTYVEYNNSAPTSNAGYLGCVTVETTSSTPNFSVTLVTNDRGNMLVTSSVSVTCVLMGDINLDGKVAQDDVELLLKWLLGAASLNESQARAADLNGNGIVDGGDASILNQYVGGVNDSVLG